MGWFSSFVFHLLWEVGGEKFFVVSNAESNRPLLRARGGVALLDRVMALHPDNDAVLRSARAALRLAQLQ